jgi:hypothetical protein
MGTSSMKKLGLANSLRMKYASFSMQQDMLLAALALGAVAPSIMS